MASIAVTTFTASSPRAAFRSRAQRSSANWNALATGSTPEELLSNYPQLTREDILAAIAYGAEAARERVIPVPVDTGA
ncbi:MAG: DUF433 domain-containing protein [Betaproteobacteria bacterium]|nr:DUF433 domain-containing protein [Betaproteobacteria bacterium]